MTRLSIERPQKGKEEMAAFCCRKDMARGPLLTLSSLKGNFKQVVAENLSAVVCKLLLKALLGACKLRHHAEGLGRHTSSDQRPLPARHASVRSADRMLSEKVATCRSMTGWRE